MQVTAASVARYAAVAAVVTTILYSGAHRIIEKQTPNGPTAGALVWELKTSSGGSIASVDEEGNLSVSGSILSGGVEVGGGSEFGTGNVLAAGDPRYVNTAGDTMTGKLTVNLASGNLAIDVKQTISGATVVAQQLSPRQIAVEFSGSGTDILTGSGKVGIPIPRSMSGFNLTNVYFQVFTAGTTNATSFHIRNVTKGNRKFLSTPASIDSGETSTATAATPYVINTSNDDVSGNDLIMLDISTVSTTAPKGGVMMLEFSKP